MQRRLEEPEGAITAARTLLETVCMHILHEAGVEFKEGIEITKLYKLTAEQLNIYPSQHEEEVFKQILGGCTSVVYGLSSLRNKLGDAHGHGPRPIKPAPPACRASR